VEHHATTRLISPKSTESSVFDVEPFGHELKAEGLSRKEEYSVVSQKSTDGSVALELRNFKS